MAQKLSNRVSKILKMSHIQNGKSVKFNKKSQVKIEDDSPESGPWVQAETWWGGNDSDCRGIDAVATDHI